MTVFIATESPSDGQNLILSYQAPELLSAMYPGIKNSCAKNMMTMGRKIVDLLLVTSPEQVLTTELSLSLLSLFLV